MVPIGCIGYREGYFGRDRTLGQMETKMAGDWLQNSINNGMIEMNTPAVGNRFGQGMSLGQHLYRKHVLQCCEECRLAKGAGDDLRERGHWVHLGGREPMGSHPWQCTGGPPLAVHGPSPGRTWAVELPLLALATVPKASSCSWAWLQEAPSLPWLVALAVPSGRMPIVLSRLPLVDSLTVSIGTGDAGRERGGGAEGGGEAPRGADRAARMR